MMDRKYVMYADAFIVDHNKILLCSFNGEKKFEPAILTGNNDLCKIRCCTLMIGVCVLKVWMNILRRLPNAMLLLLSQNHFARSNIIGLMKSLGINPARIIFLSRVSGVKKLTSMHYYFCRNAFKAAMA